MSTQRFNQEPGADYGKCTECDVSLPTEQEANEHMGSTFAEAKATGGYRGHGVRTMNPTRASRIQDEIDHLIDQAIQDALSRVDDLIDDDDITEEEAATALSRHSDFANAWQENQE